MYAYKDQRLFCELNFTYTRLIKKLTITNVMIVIYIQILASCQSVFSRVSYSALKCLAPVSVVPILTARIFHTPIR